MYEKILGKITPGSKERAEIKRLCRLTLSKIKKYGYPAEVMGSIAKDTWISGNRDIDVFVFFKPDVPLKKMEGEALSLGKKVVKALGGRCEIAYAQHPYVRGFLDGAKVDIVPCYRLETLKIKSAVDRTPFHVKYVRKKLKNKKDVRLLKQLMKAHGIYGAELKVEGFSGYLCELLIIRYKTLDNVLKNARGWAYGQVIDIEKYYKDGKLAHKKFSHHLIVVDPVDANRNVAASLSLKNFEKFLSLSAQFLSAGKKEREKFFEPKKVEVKTFQEIAGRLQNFVVIELEKPKIVEDILYPQMRKTLSRIESRLVEEDFEVVGKGAFANGKCCLALELRHVSFPKMKKHFGPPARMAEHVKKFVEKHPNAKIEGGNYVAEVERKWPDALLLIVSLVESGEVLASHLLEKQIKIYSGDRISKIYLNGFAAFLSQMVSEKWK